MKLKLNFLSMEQLDRLSRNEGEDQVSREAALRELCKRENQRTGLHVRRLTPMNYPGFYTL